MIKWLYHHWIKGRRVKALPDGSYNARVMAVREKAPGKMLIDVEILDAEG